MQNLLLINESVAPLKIQLKKDKLFTWPIYIDSDIAIIYLD